MQVPFQVSIYNIGQYDSFVLYAHALKEALEVGDDPRDGKAMVERMWNRTFPGIHLREMLFSIPNILVNVLKYGFAIMLHMLTITPYRLNVTSVYS